MEELAAVAKPDTLLAWYRKLIANKFDGSRVRQRVGRPRIDDGAERLVVQMAKENPGWGYDRIVGALANLGYLLSDQTVGNILRRHGLYVLFFIHLESRRVSLAGMTPYPGQEWMEQQARNATMEEWGFLTGCRYLLHDRDTKFCASFRELIESGSVKTIRLPARSPNLNSFAERWVRSVKEECLSRLILFGERSLRRALRQYVVHYHEERNHQGKENLILFPLATEGARHRKAAVRCRERLGGLLKYYEREAA